MSQLTDLEHIVAVAAKVAAEEALKIHQIQKEEEGKKEHDRRLRNTKLLLSNYRDFRAYVNRVENKAIEQEEVPEEADIRDLLIYGEDIVKSLKQSTQRTIVMVQQLEKALATLKFICQSDAYSDSERQYDILHLRYIKGQTIESLASKYRINERSVYKAIDVASRRLSIILFGIYGLKIE